MNKDIFRVGDLVRVRPHGSEIDGQTGVVAAGPEPALLGPPPHLRTRAADLFVVAFGDAVWGVAGELLTLLEPAATPKEGMARAAQELKRIGDYERRTSWTTRRPSKA